jgi:thiol-disulfide isomerase/thioredoxin
MLIAICFGPAIAGCKKNEPAVVRTPIAAKPAPADPCGRAVGTLVPERNESDHRVVLVLFWAPWSAPDRALISAVDAETKVDAQRWRLIKSNIDEQPKVAEACNIRSIPTLVAIVDGKPASQIVGAVPGARVRQFLDAIR